MVTYGNKKSYNMSVEPSLETIYNMWERDATVSVGDLATASMSTASLHHKYAKMLSGCKMLLRSRELKFKELYRDKWEWATGSIDRETLDRHGWEPLRKKILRSDVDVYLDADSDLQAHQLRLSEAKERVEALESIIRMINGRAFQIKNAIDYHKFMAGGQ